MIVARSVPLVAVLAMGPACELDKEPPPPEAAPVEAAAPEPVTLEGDGHYRGALDARERLVAGDLAGARGAMSWLAEPVSMKVYGPTLNTQARAMHAAARSFVTAEDNEEAAAALGRIGRVCGDCHVVANVELPPLAEPAKRKGRYDEHAFAMDNLWHALISQSMRTWSVGIESLEPALYEEAVPEGGEKYAKIVHQLTSRARVAGSWKDRGGQFGAFMATCDGCHVLLDERSAVTRR